jgi:hypothetical protein
MPISTHEFFSGEGPSALISKDNKHGGIRVVSRIIVTASAICVRRVRLIFLKTSRLISLFLTQMADDNDDNNILKCRVCGKTHRFRRRGMSVAVVTNVTPTYAQASLNCMLNQHFAQQQGVAQQTLPPGNTARVD